MALPDTLTLRRVTFQAEKGDGDPETGTVTFTRKTVLQSPGDDLFITPYARVVQLDESGAIAVDLPVTDDPDWSPPFNYDLHISLSAWEFKGQLSLPASNDDLDLADVLPTTPATPASAYVLTSAVGVPGGPAGPLDMDGMLPTDQYVSGGGGGSGTVTQVNGVSPDGSGHVTLTPANVGAQPADADLTTISALTPTNDDLLQRKAGAWVNRTTAQLKIDLSLTATDVGLSNVNNTSDANKPISTATAGALENKADLTLGKLDLAQLPDIAITTFLGAVNSQAEMTALVGQSGDWTIRNDLGTVWIITGTTPFLLSSWTQLSYPTAPVISVATKTGAVTLVKADVGLGSVDNTSDATKPLSTAAVAALAAKASQADLDTLEDRVTNTESSIATLAPKANPTFTGTVSGITKTMVGLGNVDNTADASKAFATSQITSGVFDIARIPTGATGTTVPLGNDSRFTNARTPTGAAGGVLSGTYPNPGFATDPFARVNHTGTQTADTITDGTTNKAFLATERTKLAGIASGATANSADSTLVARANHTGTQLASTISDFSSAVDATTDGGSAMGSFAPTFAAAASNTPAVVMSSKKRTFLEGGIQAPASGTTAANTLLATLPPAAWPAKDQHFLTRTIGSSTQTLVDISATDGGIRNRSAFISGGTGDVVPLDGFNWRRV